MLKKSVDINLCDSAFDSVSRWDKQLRTVPFHWHPDWLPSGGWPSPANEFPPYMPLPKWIRQRLKPQMALSDLASPQLLPAMYRLEDSVKILARLALHVRPLARRRIIRNLSWLEAKNQSTPYFITMQGVILKSDLAAVADIAEWAALGLYDWAAILRPRERAAFRLIRRCFPIQTTRQWARRLYSTSTEKSIDWNILIRDEIEL